MKKTLVLLLSLLMVASMAFAQGAEETTAAAAAPEMTFDELVAAAKAEGELSIYTFSSRSAKVAALFEEKYGIKTVATQLKDSEMIEKVSTEAISNVKAADLIFAQDSSRVYPELIMAGYVSNYVPPEYVGQFGKYEDPLVYDFCNKIFAYNDELGTSSVNNVWQLTEPEFAGLIQFKDPFQEGVNMNFFTMITRDDWAQKLADAYKDLYGKEIELTTPNAGYEWIKGLYANAVLGKSDTTISENVGAKGQAKQLYGLFTLNKFRNEESKNLALDVLYDMKPFAGFMYPVYAQIPSNSTNIAAAKLFLHFCFTEEGWAPYAILGDYSAKADLVNKEDPISFAEWESMLVVEDPAWCAEHRAEVEEFISNIM